MEPEMDPIENPATETSLSVPYLFFGEGHAGGLPNINKILCRAGPMTHPWQDVLVLVVSGVLLFLRADMLIDWTASSGICTLKS